MAISDLAQFGDLLRKAPDALRLYGAARRAVNGDEQALDYLKQQGWQEALDLVRPGAGAVGRNVLESIQELRLGNVIEGEYRVVEQTRPPFQTFCDWIQARRWGSVVLLGPKGSGKTTLALRLAQLWQQRTGWPVEGVQLYPEDALPFVKRISARTFTARLKTIAKYLDADDTTESEEGEYPETTETIRAEEVKKLTKFISLKSLEHRIVIIDETSLTGTTLGTNAGRAMLRGVMAQARHVKWLIVYIGQLTRMMPLDILTCEAVFVKKPQGWEADADRDEPIVRMLWSSAMEAFRGVKAHPYWEMFPDSRSWAYVICHQKRFNGLVPFSLPGDTDDDNPQENKEE